MLRSLIRPTEDRSPGQEPRRGLMARLLVGAGAAFLVAVPFTLLMLLVLSEWEPLERLDRGVADELNDVARGDTTLVHVLRFGSVALDPWVFRVAVIAVAVWLWRRGARRLALWAVITAVIGGVLGVVLKVLVDRARPSFPEPVATASGYSFPSGHALNSMLGVGILILVFLPVLTRAGKTMAYALGAVLVLLTGYDRVALGVHYVSDVLAGWVVALACLAGTSAGFEIWRREQGRRPSDVDDGVDPEAADAMSDSPPPDGRFRPMRNRVARIAGRVIISLAVLYGVLVGIGLLLTKVFERSALIREEDELNQALADGRTPTMNDVTYVLSGLGNTGTIIGAMLIVAIGLRLASKKWRLSIFLVLAVSAQALVFLLVTLTISRQRPDVKKLDDSPPTSSFPSGHTGAATALFLASALLVAWYVKRRWVKILALTLLISVPLLVAYGRLYRGMHHPTDIVGAYLNGIASITIAATSVLGRGRRRGDGGPDPSPAPVTTGATGMTA